MDKEIASLVADGILQVQTLQRGAVHVSTLTDGIGVCVDHRNVLQQAGFRWSALLERWAKCNVGDGLSVLADLLGTGALSGKIKEGELLFSDGLARTADVASLLKRHGCKWDATTYTWWCAAKKEHSAAILETARRRKAAMDNSCTSNVSTLQRRVEDAVGARIDAWPIHLARAARAPKIGYRAEKHDSGVGRRVLTLFCIHNGCSPSLYIEWLRDRDCIKADAWGEMKHTIAKMASGNGCGHTWDLKARAKMPARTLAESDASDVERANAALMAAGQHDASSVTRLPPPAFVEYYSSIFPYTEVARLLHCHSSPFQLRTIAYCQTDGKRALQSRPVLDLDMLRRCMHKYGCTSLHAGPAFTAGTQEPRLDGPLGTELVLEIDEVPSDVDPAHRWEWLRHAVEVTVLVLREWFGFTDLFCFASGNRGPHLWVRDEGVLQQTLVERTRFFERLRRPQEEPNWQELANRLLVPFVARWHPNDQVQPTTERLVQFAFPTFDAEVALQPKHLHRLPFSIHEKTGRVAIPFASSPPFAGMPARLEDMPRVDEPDLKGALAAPLEVLRSVLGAASVRDVMDVVAEKPDAEWRKTKKTHKRKEHAGEADLPVASLQVCRTAAIAWVSALRLAAATASEVRTIDDADVRSIAERSDEDGKDWRARLRSEADAVGQLLEAVGDAGLLHGETYTSGDGRTLTRYPQLNQAQFVQRLAKATRHAITKHAYAEVDLSTAHVAAAWGACEQHYGAEAGARLCSHLRLAATDKKASRAKVKSQNRSWSDARCKRAILATLNQEPDDGILRSRFLDGLVKEREHMVIALRAHSAVAGAPLESIKRKCVGHPKPAVREFSLMLQTLEGAIVRSAVQTFRTHGFETAAFIADGLFVRPISVPFAGDQVNAALDTALGAVTDAVREALCVSVAMECEHAIRA